MTAHKVRENIILWKCSACKEWLPEEDYGSAPPAQLKKSSKRPVRYNCKACHNEYIKKWQKTNERAIKKNKSYTRERDLKRFYGISLEQYDQMNKAQEGKCALCKEKCCSNTRLSVDHCHTTGLVRGLLCHRCNTALGLLKDNIQTVESALSYLKRCEGKNAK